MRIHPRFSLKLRTTGTTHEGPSHDCRDNQSVLTNATTPESTLKKKSSSLARRVMREGVAMDDWRSENSSANGNESDLLTKVMPFGEKRREFMSKVLMNVYGSS